MDQQKTGRYIAEKRKLHNMTQAQLATKLGVSDKAVSKWERGLSLPDVSKYQELCELLEVSLNELFAGEDLAEAALAEQSERNLMEAVHRAAYGRKQLIKVIVLLAVCIAVLVAGYIANLTMRESENDNRLGQLKYGITSADDNYTHYMDREPMVGVTVLENENAYISKKSYFNMEYMTEIEVEKTLYESPEEAYADAGFGGPGNQTGVTADDDYAYSSYHDLPADQLGEGINRITCGILDSGGAMAWIFTDCGIYTMTVRTMNFDDKYCEEELHFFLNGVSIDKTLKDESYKL